MYSSYLGTNPRGIIHEIARFGIEPRPGLGQVRRSTMLPPLSERPHGLSERPHGLVDVDAMNGGDMEPPGFDPMVK